MPSNPDVTDNSVQEPILGGDLLHDSDQDESVTHENRIEQELRAAGMTWFGLMMAESRYLPRILNTDEHVKAIVYGWQPGAAVLLAATDHRIIYLDKKLLFVRDDEVSYDSVRGISFLSAGLASTTILHTQVQDYTVRTFNRGCAKRFKEYVESRSFEHKTDAEVVL